MTSKVDIRSVRFIPNMSTTSKIFIDKKRKNKNRKVLNNPKNWN